MKAVLLAGGKAARLDPVSRAVNKHLLPVYDQPMIFHPLRTLVQAGASDILLVTGPEHVEAFRRLLGGGEGFGCRLRYACQTEPDGTAAAVLSAESFIDGEDFLVILGDNLFSDDVGGAVRRFRESRALFEAKVLVHQVGDPRPFGVAAFQGERIAAIVEKPQSPPSHYVVTGLWMLSPGVFDRLRRLSRSLRGEYEMTEVLDRYAREGRLDHSFLKGIWMDVGSFESLHKAAVWARSSSRRANRDRRRAGGSPPISAAGEVEEVCCGGSA